MHQPAQRDDWLVLTGLCQLLETETRDCYYIYFHPTDASISNDGLKYMAESTSTKEYEFLANIRDHFNLDELQELNLLAGVPDEELAGATRTARVIALYTYCHRHSLLPNLLQACRRLRPLVNWPDEIEVIGYRALKESTRDLLEAFKETQDGKKSASTFVVNARQSQVGVIGEDVHIEGGIHFHAPPPSFPLQRPPRAEHFTDRERELKQLLTDLQPGRVTTLWGPGGIGKTALAAEVIWVLAPGQDPPNLFPDGIIFHSFYNQPQASQALESIALAFGQESKPTPRDAAQRALANRTVLLVFDGSEDADDLQAVLDVRGGCGVLITSRARKDAVAQRQDLQPLQHDDAIDLLRAWGDNQAIEIESAGRICQLVGYLPLAVRLAGRYLDETGEMATEYVKWLEETPLLALDHGQRRMESVPVLLEKSLAQVGKEANQVLALVGLLALAPFGQAPVVAGLDLALHHLRQPLDDLVRFGLLLRKGERFEVSHALLHTFARLRLSTPEGTLERLGSYFVQISREHQAGQRDVEEMDMARPHVMAVLGRLMDEKIWEHIVDLAHTLTRSRGEGYLQVRGFWNDEEEVLNRAIEASDFLMRSVEEDRIGYWARHMADLKFALGDLSFYRDQYDLAAGLFEESIVLYDKEGGSQEQAVATHLKLGEIYLNKSEFEGALKHFESSLEISKRLGKTEGALAPIHLWLGRTYRRQGSHSEAMRHYQNSLTLYQGQEDWVESAFVLVRQGVLAFDMNEEEQAWGFLHQAEALLNQAGQSFRAAEIRRELGNQYRWRKNFEKGRELQQLSLQDFYVLDDRHNIAWTLQGLGDTYFEMGDNSQAEKYFNEALKYFLELGMQHGLGYAYDHLGMIRIKQNRLNEAREFFEKGLMIFRGSGLRDGIAYLLFNLADTERSLGELEKAKKHYNESLEIWKELKNSERVTLTKQKLKELPDNLHGTDVAIEKH